MLLTIFPKQCPVVLEKENWSEAIISALNLSIWKNTSLIYDILNIV